MSSDLAQSADYDVAIIGAGPAGMAAAASATRLGRRVVLLDAAAGVGGQYWRHQRNSDGSKVQSAAAFHRLMARLEGESAAGRLAWRPGHTVWRVEPSGCGFAVHALAHGLGCQLTAPVVVIATGAHDRQLPFPGWTLPGVVTAGGAQALLKGNGVVVGRRVAVAGTGPLLFPVAAGLAAAGAKVVGVFEAGQPLRLARHPGAVLSSTGKLVEGARAGLTMLRCRVPYQPRTSVVAALGDRELVGVRVARLDENWEVIPGSARDVLCDALAVGFGFTPRVELHMQIGCAMTVDQDGCLIVRVDGAQETTVRGIYAAGEPCGVAGAEAALADGDIAGRAAAASTGAVGPEADRDDRAARRRRAHGRAFGLALQEAFPIRPGWRSWIAPDTIVCRCEEVPAAAVRAAVSTFGATEARAAKLLSRAGMGLCQGRVCGYAVADLAAAESGRLPLQDDLEGLGRRPLAFPVPLAVLADATRAGCEHPGQRLQDPSAPGSPLC